MCSNLEVVCMERVEHFSASHRLHSPQLNEEENRKTYGKCNNPNGHGHNYVWRVFLKGPIDPITGMVFDLAVVKRAMAEVNDIVDHKNLDKDVEWFKNIVSTSENVAKFLYLELEKRLPEEGRSKLSKVVLEETPRNIFTYKKKAN